jgi:hypothetical protein
LSGFETVKSGQATMEAKKFKLGPLGNLTQVTRGLSKTIRAMADGRLDSQIGASICNGLGIMRQCLETVQLEQLEARLSDMEGTAATDGDYTTDNQQAYRAH